MNFLTRLIAYVRTFRLSYGERLQPHRDWLLVLSLSLLALVISGMWNIWYFLSITQQELLQEVQEENQGILDRSVLEEERATLMEHAQEAERYRQEYRFNDPAR